MNYLKANTDKSQLLLTPKDEGSIKIDSTYIKSSSKNLLGVLIDNKLTINENVFKLCKWLWLGFQNIWQKTNVELWMAFFTFQSAYCPLVWMSHNWTLNYKINKLQERALRLVHDDNTSSFYEIPQKDNFFSIHYRNIQKLALEMYRSLHWKHVKFFNLIVSSFTKFLPYYIIGLGIKNLLYLVS